MSNKIKCRKNKKSHLRVVTGGQQPRHASETLKQMDEVDALVAHPLSPNDVSIPAAVKETAPPGATINRPERAMRNFETENERKAWIEGRFTGPRVRLRDGKPSVWLFTESPIGAPPAQETDTMSEEASDEAFVDAWERDDEAFLKWKHESLAAAVKFADGNYAPWAGVAVVMDRAEIDGFTGRYLIYFASLSDDPGQKALVQRAIMRELRKSRFTVGVDIADLERCTLGVEESA